MLNEKPCGIEALFVNSGVSSSTPSGGFKKGDPVKLTDYKTGRECTANTDTVHGVLITDLAYPYTNKTLQVATKGLVEVTASGAVSIDAFVGLDSSDPRKYTALTLSASGTTYRQAFRAKSTASSDGDKFIIDLDDVQMVTV